MPDDLVTEPRGRLRLLLVLSTMPDEAFVRFVAWAATAQREDPGLFEYHARQSLRDLHDAAVEWTRARE